MSDDIKKRELDMKKKIAAIAAILVLSFCLSGCQTITRKYGGTTELDLEPGLKLEEITWKDDDSLWYLTRPMTDEDIAETHTFKESSLFGICEGTVIIREHKK